MKQTNIYVQRTTIQQTWTAFYVYRIPDEILAPFALYCVLLWLCFDQIHPYPSWLFHCTGAILPNPGASDISLMDICKQNAWIHKKHIKPRQTKCIKPHVNIHGKQWTIRWKWMRENWNEHDTWNIRIKLSIDISFQTWPLEIITC